MSTLPDSLLVPPLVSFIVATRNAAHEIGGCINNFRKFHFPIQLIIKDGLSTDDTIKIIGQHADRVDCLIQRGDTGIYSAWNQALPSARGAYVAFCGADDRPNANWYMKHQDVLRVHSATIDLIYGDLVKTLFGKFRKYPTPDSTRIAVNDLARFWLPHPGLLHSARLFRDSQFREDLKLAGDFHFLLSAAVNRRYLNVLKLAGTQCVMQADGMSHSPYAAKTYADEFDSIREELNISIHAPGFSANMYSALNKISPRFAHLTRQAIWFAKGSASWE